MYRAYAFVELPPLIVCVRTYFMEAPQDETVYNLVGGAVRCWAIVVVVVVDTLTTNCQKTQNY